MTFIKNLLPELLTLSIVAYTVKLLYLHFYHSCNQTCSEISFLFLANTYVFEVR